MKPRVTQFLPLTPTKLLPGQLQDIQIKELVGFESQTNTGHLSNSICSPIIPIVYKQSNTAFILINEADSRLTEIIESLSCESTISAFVLEADVLGDEEMTLLRFIAGYMNPNITPDISIFSSLKILSQDEELQESVLNAFDITPRRGGKIGNCIISAEGVQKILGRHAPAINTLKKALGIDPEGIQKHRCTEIWESYGGNQYFQKSMTYSKRRIQNLQPHSLSG